MRAGGKNKNILVRKNQANRSSRRPKLREIPPVAFPSCHGVDVCELEGARELSRR